MREVERGSVRGEGGEGGGGSRQGVYVAYLFVHCLAILSCSVLLVKYCVAMLPTRGSAETERERSINLCYKLKSPDVKQTTRQIK